VACSGVTFTFTVYLFTLFNFFYFLTVSVMTLSVPLSRCLVNNELESMRKEAVVTYLKYLPEEHHEETAMKASLQTAT
jgi:hypothetical protein